MFQLHGQDCRSEDQRAERGDEGGREEVQQERHPHSRHCRAEGELESLYRKG